MTDEPAQLVQNEFDLLDREAGGSVPEDDARRLIEFGRAIYRDIPYPEYEGPEGKLSFSASTVRQYLLRLRVDVLKNAHTLTDISAEEFNELMVELDADRARSTTTQAQSSAKHFFRYHDDLGVDPDAIAIFDEDQSQKQVDPASLLTFDEIEAIRREIDNSVNPIRNRAFLEMLVYTGQRIRALRTLRLGDVHPEEKPGYLMLNPDVDGLKNALERGRRRPLLASRKYVREWKERHPQRGDPDAWFFVAQANHANSNPDMPWSYDAMVRTLKRAAKRAGIENYNERVHPHAFRHFWYTSMRKQENADPEDLKAVGGWKEGSSTPEMVYKNFEDEEHGERLERQLGYRDSEETRRFIPELCPVCGEPLEAHWKQCPNCGEEFVDDRLREAEQDVAAQKHEQDEEDPDKWADVQRILLDNPEKLEEILRSDE